MKEKIREIIGKAIIRVFPETTGQVFEIAVDYPTREHFGDFTTNVALKSAGLLKRKPLRVADELATALRENPLFVSVDVAGPGFINFTLSPESWFAGLKEVELKGALYGHSTADNPRRIQVEFVSANPTGPLHVGHGRGAAVGDALARLLRAAGHEVDTEYYVNDVGRQMRILGHSVFLRMLEISGQEIIFPEDHYQGAYIREIAGSLLEEEGEMLFSLPEEAAVRRCGEIAAARILLSITDDLEAFNVRFNRWFSEKALLEENEIESTLAELKEKGYIKEEDDATWFLSSRFGDEKDRVVVRKTGETTYFASDIAYHREKFSRGYDLVIDVWGADHHGYIPRMKGVVAALGYDPRQLEVVLIQLVNLLRKGRKVSMSTRGGTFVTLREVLDEVGRDAARYFFLMRRSDSPLDFDLDLARKQSNENPVFYVQYAHARVCSIEKKAREAGIRISGYETVDWHNVTLPEEVRLMKRIAMFPEVVKGCAETLEPHRTIYFLHELAGEFHHYYNHIRVITENIPESEARFFLVRCVRQVIKNGLALMGITAPEKM
jgi:arginyl-tRNA synthetase